MRHIDEGNTSKRSSVCSDMEKHRGGTMQRQSDLAERVQQACIEAAVAAYECGGISGVCAEGRWELAIEAMRCMDLRPFAEIAKHGADSEGR